MNSSHSLPISRGSFPHYPLWWGQPHGQEEPSRIGTIGASRVIFAITSRFATQAVQQRRKRRGIAFYALHVRIRAMLKQKLYNIKVTLQCRSM